MVTDITVKMYIEIPVNPLKSETEQYKEISYILNLCCSALEDSKFSVFYSMKDSNDEEIHLDIP